MSSTVDDIDVYEVESLMDHRNSSVGEGVEYFVKWKGFPPEANTWEPERNFIERKCISEYWKERNSVEAEQPSQVRRTPKRKQNFSNASRRRSKRK